MKVSVKDEGWGEFAEFFKKRDQKNKKKKTRREDRDGAWCGGSGMNGAIKHIVEWQYL
jgi:hypothetical protein